MCGTIKLVPKKKQSKKQNTQRKRPENTTRCKLNVKSSGFFPRFGHLMRSIWSTSIRPMKAPYPGIDLHRRWSQPSWNTGWLGSWWSTNPNNTPILKGNSTSNLPYIFAVLDFHPWKMGTFNIHPPKKKQWVVSKLLDQTSKIVKLSVRFCFTGAKNMQSGSNFHMQI